MSMQIGSATFGGRLDDGFDGISVGRPAPDRSFVAPQGMPARHIPDG